MAQPGRSRPPITPIPAPDRPDRLVLFGGTFDPPHRAHAELAALARQHAPGAGAWLVFVPAARSPHKDAAPTPEHHRLEMLRRAIAGVPRACVWTDEIDRAARGEPSYWIDTLRRAKSLRPDAGLWFILGSDQAAAFHGWREPREILALAEPIVLPRAPLVTPGSLGAALRGTGAWCDAEIAAWERAFAPTPVLDSSATGARAMLRSRGVDDPRLGDLLDPAVISYIREHGLYSPPA